ncbi:solute carrier family 10 member 6 isoform X2 [Anoplophora glabripennis]|nr:solute carrier family 10 member 6 isoform X2 [Anoplophora glabripennis]XP_018567524.1 solute carrier family 10 member 6 isoform X2 [Anoplophora glabripennis]XP_018567525.1 solute carrier family 10 member 6 isoform X2 [Anoplophora glabripennis]
MCPISGMVQFLIVIVTLLLVCHAVVVNMLKISFTPSNVTLSMSDSHLISYEITDLGNIPGDTELLIYSEDKNIAFLEKEIVISNPLLNFAGTFNITGNFLGKTIISCKDRKTGKIAEDSIDVVVVRKKRFIDTLFTASVATLVSILYINFGCAIDWSGEFRNILRRPIGPAIGFCGQFIAMPLLSYALGRLIFPNNPEMQLGMFFTGVSPAGGASNVWAVLLEGNLSLSIVMTTISTIAAFGMMPFWLFTLGQLIFKSSDLEVPYRHIMTYVFALVIPLGIGYLLQRYLKRVAQFMTRIIKGFSSCLILFIIIFAIVTNLYLFQLFSWEIVTAGLALPWLGYVAGYLLAKLFKQPPPDCLTIAIEVGIQNTGIAIFLLRFALPQPQADLTTVVPVAVAIMTPFPLLAIFIYKKIRARLSTSSAKLNGDSGSFPKIDGNCNGVTDGSDEKLTSATRQIFSRDYDY